MNLLTKAEADRLRELERVVEAGLETFYEVGAALTEIRDKRLYKTAHSTFEDYCRERWDMTRRRADQLIQAAETIALIEDQAEPPKSGQIVQVLRTRVLKPSHEKQVRPLNRLPQEERSDAWNEAVETAPDGKVTTKHVEKTVDRRTGKNGSAQPKKASEPEPTPSTGKSRINGVLTDDPPDIAAKRADGKIAPEVIPDITEGDAEETEPLESDLGDDALSDDEWLDLLPARAKLEGVNRDRFDADALLYRAMEPARAKFKNQATHHIGETAKLVRERGIKAGRRAVESGAFYFLLKRFLGVDHPRRWLLCPKTEDGGCGGAGQLVAVGDCTKCFGRGYWIK